MAKHYKETPWWWYVIVLVVSFVIGLVVVIKENITLPAWAYIVSLLLGIFIAPLVSLNPCKAVMSSQTRSNFGPVEHYSLLSVRQRYRHEQLVEDVGRSDASWSSCW